jgi:hypothetical protein
MQAGPWDFLINARKAKRERTAKTNKIDIVANSSTSVNALDRDVGRKPIDAKKRKPDESTFQLLESGMKCIPVKKQKIQSGMLFKPRGLACGFRMELRFITDAIAFF